MTQTILTAGDSTNSTVAIQGGNDGTFRVVVGPNGGKVAAVEYDAIGNAKMAASIQFADSTAMNSANSLGMRNRIINGAMNIDQRNNGAAVVAVATVNVVDRFGAANTTGTGTLTVQQSTMTGFGKSSKATATVAITALTTTLYLRTLFTIIESQNCFDLNAKTVTLSFTVETNWTGNLAVSVRNSGNTRSYVTNVAVVSGINTRSVVVPLESTTIATNDNATGLNIDIGFCNEATYQTATTGSWIAGSFLTSTTSTQWCKTAGNFVNITQVQLEQGAVATPFEQRPIGLELALCQRYFEKSYGAGVAIGAATLAGSLQSTAATPFILSNGSMRYKVEKRAVPTITLYSPNAGAMANVSEYNVASTFVADRPSVISSSDTSGAVFQVGGTATAGNNIQWHYIATAEYF